MADDPELPPEFSPDSIFDTIKKMLGVDVEDTGFDMDIIVHINSVLMTLSQLGVAPEEGFSITDNSSTWSDLLVDSTKLEATKSYMYLKVKMLFDPPSTSFVLESMNRSITEWEWRLAVQTTPAVVAEEGDEDDC